MNQIEVYFPPRHKEVTALGYVSYRPFSEPKFFSIMTQFGSPYYKYHSIYKDITNNYSFPTQRAIVTIAYFINNMSQCNNSIKNAIYVAVLLSHKQVMQRMVRKNIKIDRYYVMTRRFVEKNYDSLYDALYPEANHIAKIQRGELPKHSMYTNYDASNGWYAKLLAKKALCN